jgi:ORF6N domain
MMQLTEEEVEIMVSQNAIPSKKVLGGSLPYAFTEHGVLMLANVLKSGRAIEMSIKIIEIFVKMREMFLTHKDILLKLEKIEKMITSNDEDIAVLFSYLKQLLKSEEQKNEQGSRKRIGFKSEE